MAFPFLHPKSNLDTEHLLELMQCLCQIRLISHHLVNRFGSGTQFRNLESELVVR